MSIEIGGVRFPHSVFCAVGARGFFGEGYWKTPETWPRIGAKPTAKEIAWKKFEERTRDADEAE